MVKHLHYIILGIILGGCVETAGTQTLVEKLDEETPEFIIHDADIRIVQDQEFRFQVGSLTYYSEKDEYEAENIEFLGYSLDGEKKFSGQAGFAKLFETSNDIELRENITLSVYDQGITIEGESFAWTDLTGEFAADPEDEVIINKTDGSFFRGRGFVINEYTEEIRFSQASSGVISTETPDDEAEATDEEVEKEANGEEE